MENPQGLDGRHVLDGTISKPLTSSTPDLQTASGKPAANETTHLPESLQCLHWLQSKQKVAPSLYGFPLYGKVALITGGGRGIGAGIARMLADKGCRTVIINYSSSADAAEKIRKELVELGTQAIAIKADLTKVEEIVHLFQTAVDLAGGLDIVVSNSGRGQ